MIKACVVIPVYSEQISAYEQISMDQCFQVLQQHAIYFVVPQRLEAFAKNHPYVRQGKAKYKTFNDRFFADIPAYNRLMKFNGFYKSFLDYDYMLIHQLDAFVFRDEFSFWCAQDYDFIGAPLFEGHDQADQSAVLVGQGNGGFSLRNIKACYHIVSHFKKLNFKRSFDSPAHNLMIRAYRYVKHQLIYNFSGYPFQPIINEDLFWAEVIPENFSWFRVPSPQTSIKFSFEVHPEILYRLNHHELPFGCHAWWKYDLSFWKNHIRASGYNI